MSLFLPNDPDLNARLTDRPDGLLIVCYCAAWCDTCGTYRTAMTELAQRQNQWTFVWADIEDYPDLLGDEDVENFPTILIERNGEALFFGTMLPHIHQLERLAQSLDDPDAEMLDDAAPEDVREMLLAGPSPIL